MNMNKKQPLGLKPFDLFYEQVKRTRLLQIDSAIQRYQDACLPIPEEWLEEYLDLTELSPFTEMVVTDKSTFLLNMN